MYKDSEECKLLASPGNGTRNLLVVLSVILSVYRVSDPGSIMIIMITMMMIMIIII